jgi:hypothetical protein
MIRFQSRFRKFWVREQVQMQSKDQMNFEVLFFVLLSNNIEDKGNFISNNFNFGDS